MKTLALIMVATVVLAPASLSAQKGNGGIYFTAADYEKHRLSVVVACGSGRQGIHADMIFRPNEISIRQGGSRTNYAKDSVYAIQYCNGSIVRIYNNSAFPLINPRETIMIYKVRSGVNSKASTAVINYYFSVSADGMIHELTIHNLKSAFADNNKFKDLIDAEFKNDSELIQFDKVNKMMKINQLLRRAIAQK